MLHVALHGLLSLEGYMKTNYTFRSLKTCPENNYINFIKHLKQII